MVSRLDCPKEARELLEALHSFLRYDLQINLPSLREGRRAATHTFGALLGVMRASNPLHKDKAGRALQALKVVCPLTRRFPTTFTGKLSHYEDAKGALDYVIDVGGNRMDVHKMWRLLVWIYFGNGGHNHEAWKLIEKTPVARSWRPDVRQPFELVRFAITQVGRTGGHMRVFGSDGLDKKSRLGQDRILYPVDWHQAVPRLTEAFNKCPEDFRKVLSTVRGLRGELTQKEIIILFEASRYKRFQRVGRELLPFGLGARNGAKAFLGIPQMKGKDSAAKYNIQLTKQIPQLQSIIKRYFPRLPAKMQEVTLGDIEPCLCAAFVYSKLVKKLRPHLPGGRWDAQREKQCWLAVSALHTPPGFIPHNLQGKRELRNHVKVPRLPYRDFRLRELPPKSAWTKRKLFEMWGGPPIEPPRQRKRARELSASGGDSSVRLSTSGRFEPPRHRERAGVYRAPVLLALPSPSPA